jgi:hypothetical protein
VPFPVRAVEVEYELLEALEWAVSRAGEMGSGFRVRDVDFWVGIDMDGLGFVEVEVVEVTDRVS